MRHCKDQDRLPLAGSQNGRVTGKRGASPDVNSACDGARKSCLSEMCLHALLARFEGSLLRKILALHNRRLARQADAQVKAPSLACKSVLPSRLSLEPSPSLHLPAHSLRAVIEDAHHVRPAILATHLLPPTNGPIRLALAQRQLYQDASRR